MARRLFALARMRAPGLARRHATSLLTIASVVWVVLSLVVAVRHGADRRRSFNAPQQRCERCAH